MVSMVPNGLLRKVRNLPVSAKAQAGLIGTWTRKVPNTKVRLSEPLCLLDGGQR